MLADLPVTFGKGMLHRQYLSQSFNTALSSFVVKFGFDWKTKQKNKQNMKTLCDNTQRTSRVRTFDYLFSPVLLFQHEVKHIQVMQGLKQLLLLLFINPYTNQYRH